MTFPQLGAGKRVARRRPGVRAKANPSDGKHVLPMTQMEEQMFKANKPSQGLLLSALEIRMIPQIFL